MCLPAFAVRTVTVFAFPNEPYRVSIGTSYLCCSSHKCICIMAVPEFTGKEKNKKEKRKRRRKGKKIRTRRQSLQDTAALVKNLKK